METPMPETLVQIFLDSAARYRKPAMFMRKRRSRNSLLTPAS